jgi:Peptidase S46
LLAVAATACTSASPSPAPAPMTVTRVDTVRIVDTVTPLPAVPDTALAAGRFDNGKMWTFEYPPLEYFRETYGFAPDSAWFAKARSGALRLPNCTASFVSADGLVLTNHHCAREGAVAVARPGETPLDSGFYAATAADERRVPDLYVDQLIALEDLTAALDTVPDEGREAALEALSDRVTQRYGGDTAGIVVETVQLWNGARVWAYVFRRFDDVRLVMVPELQVAFFGGDPDNFTYPRYDLDMAFLRVYRDDAPYRPDVFFPWSAAGVGEGDAVFVIGNPGSTNRLQTVAQLEFRRDVSDPAFLAFLRTRIAALEGFARESPAAAESVDVRNKIFSLSNSEKSYAGMLAGLNDPVIMARRQDGERRFQQAIAGDSALAGRYGDLIERLAGVQQQKRRFATPLGVYAALGAPDWESAALLRGFFAAQYLGGRRSGAPAEAVAEVREGFAGVHQQPAAMQERLLAARLEDLSRYLGDTSAVVRQMLAGMTAEQRARAVVRQSVLADSAGAAAALDAGTLRDDDPGMRLAVAMLSAYFAFQREYGPLTQEEEAAALDLGRARFAVSGTSEPPDATFSLRIADGVVQGYRYNGTEAPIHTTFYGMLDRYRSFGAGSAWDLPPRWQRPPASFDPGTPLNFIATADIIGGNSGSPVLNRNLELVGLAFDGNIESLPGDYIFLPEKNRTVAVDARAMLEALGDLYGARRLVAELRAARR